MSLRKNVPPLPGWAPAAGMRNCCDDGRVATTCPLAATAMRMAAMVTMALRMQKSPAVCEERTCHEPLRPQPADHLRRHPHEHADLRRGGVGDDACGDAGKIAGR